MEGSRFGSARRTIALAVAVAGLALLPRAALAREAQDSLTNGEVREVELSMPDGARVEYFRLDPPTSDDGARKGRPIGVVRWLTGSSVDARTGETGGFLAHCEINLFAERTRVLHTEQLHAEKRELVFREVRPRAGRTIALAWTPNGEASATESGGRETRRRTYDMTRGGVFPLALVELARKGKECEDEMRTFQPLAAEFELLRVTQATDGDERTLTLRRANGLEAGSYRFRGEDLVSFRWQAGGPIATRIDASAFEALVAAEDPDDESEDPAPPSDER